MKKLSIAAVGLCLASMLALASPKNSSWEGWISDSKCGVNGANAAHAACAKKCIANGEKPVLVTDQDQKVVNIDNPSAVTGHEGQHVKITGTMKDGAIHVEKVAMVSQ